MRRCRAANRLAAGLLGLALLAPAGTASAADWPQFRADAARTGYTSEELPAKLQLEWTFKPAHPPRPSWPHETRVVYDRASHAVVAGGTVYFGSSADDRVCALDAATGKERWCFFTGAPVRCPPAVWKDRVYAASDDGHLYCLAAADGKLLWKKRAGPRDDLVLGHGRPISRWPARGGPAVADGAVYFAAGIWPADGTYLLALDAETGKELWANAASGTQKRENPHVSQPMDTGFGFQGPLAVTADAVLAPTGRGMAAVFDRKTGAFRSLKTMGQGGSGVAVIDSLIFDGGYVFDTRTGKEVRRGLSPLAVAAGPGWIVGGTPTALTFIPRAKTPEGTKKPGVSNEKAGGAALIVAGGRAYSAGGKRVVAVQIDSGKLAWSAEVDGTPWGLAASGGRLYVSTDAGSIHCFGAAGGGRVLEEKPPDPVPGAGGEWARAAEEILKTSGIGEGWCLDLGCGDGRLALELARQSKLTICGVEKDPELVAAARQRLAAAGLYGTRVTVLQADPARTGLPARFANLVVSGRSVTEGSGAADAAEAARLVRPWGGTVCLGKPGALKKEVRGALPGAGQWTHQYGSAAAPTASADALVRGPLTVRWFDGPDLDVPNRHGRAPAPLFFEGVLYVMGREALSALDAYNGRPLWQAPFKDIGKPYLGEDLLGTAGTGSTLCAAPEGIFVRHGGKCARLDRLTGERLAEFSLPDEDPKGIWGFVACDGGVLLGSAADTAHQVPFYYQKADMSGTFVESKSLFALEPATGKLLWSFRPKCSIRNNTVVMGGGRVYLIDREKAEEQPRSKPLVKPHKTGELVCLEAATGKELWRRTENVWGTVLSLSVKHDVLLMSGQPAFSGFGLTSDQVGRLAGFQASSGKPLWEAKSSHLHRPVVADRTIYLSRGKLDLLEGKMEEFRIIRQHGCGMVSGSARLLLFRSGVLGYIDLEDSRRTRHFGAIRPGCWVNAIPAGGMVLMPDFSTRCGCSYDNKACVALESAATADPQQ